MTWFLFAILTAILWAASGLIDKMLVSRLRHPLTVDSLGSIMGGLIGIVILFFWGDAVSLPTKLIGLAIGVLAFFSVACYLFALQREEATRVIPLYGLTNIFVVLFAFIFLGQPLTVAITTAMFLVIGGSFLLESDLKNRLITRKPAALILMLLASLMWASAILLAEHFLDSVSPLTLLGWTEIGAGLMGVVFVLVYRQHLLHGLRARLAIPGIAATTFLDVVGTFTKFSALALTYAASVQIVAASQDLFLFAGAAGLSLFAPRFLKEKTDGYTVGTKVIAIILIAAGVLLISITG